MEHIKQMQTSVQNQQGLKGWLKRKLFGSVLEAAGKDDDILLKIAAETRDNAAKSIAALQELEQADRALKTGGKLPEYKLMFLKIYGKV